MGPWAAAFCGVLVAMWATSNSLHKLQTEHAGELRACEEELGVQTRANSRLRTSAASLRVALWDILRPHDVCLEELSQRIHAVWNTDKPPLNAVQSYYFLRGTLEEGSANVDAEGIRAGARRIVRVCTGRENLTLDGVARAHEWPWF